MSNSDRAIIVPEVIALHQSGARITSIGLQVDADKPLSFEEWADIGPGIGKGQRAYSWAAGDWINYGIDKYPDMYTQAMDATGLSLGRLRNLKSLCDRVPHGVRNPNLTISHHESVSPFPIHYQKQLLDLAEKFSIDRDTFRELVNDIKDTLDLEKLEASNGQLAIQKKKVTTDVIVDRAKHVASAWRKGQGQMNMTLHQALEDLANVLGVEDE